MKIKATPTGSTPVALCDEKLYDEGNVASVATLRRGSLFIKRLLMKLLLVVSMAGLCFCIGWIMSHVGWVKRLLNARDDYFLCTVSAVGGFLFAMIVSRRKRTRFGWIFSACLSAFIIFCSIRVVCVYVMMMRIDVKALTVMIIFGVVATAWFVLIISLVRNKRVMPTIWVAIGFACSVPILFKGAVFCGTGLERYLNSRVVGVAREIPGQWVTVTCGCCDDCTCTIKYFHPDGVQYEIARRSWECSGCRHECGCPCKHRSCNTAFGICTTGGKEESHN